MRATFTSDLILPAIIALIIFYESSHYVIYSSLISVQAGQGKIMSSAAGF